MGGTTAKICLIDDGEPQHRARFEVGAQLPLPEGQRPAAAHPGDRDGRDRRRRRLDRLGRRAGAHHCRAGKRRRRARPGLLRPRRHRAHRDRCRRRAGPHRSRRISPAARSSSTLDKAGAAVDKRDRRRRSASTRLDAAFGVSEIVEENMANAARVHAVERGKDLQSRTMIAFGGARAAACRAAGREARHPPRHGAGGRRRRLGGRLPARADRLRGRAQPLRAARDACSIPPDAQRAVRRDARRGRSRGARPARRRGPLVERGTADMRYRGQGHEITVQPARPARSTAASRAELRQALRSRLRARLFGRDDPGLERRGH